MKYRLNTSVNHVGYPVLKSTDREKRQIYEHVLVAEKAMGKEMPKGGFVHHRDECKTNNKNSNLLVCDRDYHALIHIRLEAKKACGNPDWLKCRYCGQYDDIENLRMWGGRGRHVACIAKKDKERYDRRKHDNSDSE